jgi:antitoxin HigA-1
MRHKGVVIHPGEIFQHEFLIPMKVTQAEFAKHIGVRFQRVNEIVRGKRGITADTAYLFSEAFGTTPEFWLNLQTRFELASFKPVRHVKKLKSA